MLFHLPIFIFIAVCASGVFALLYSNYQHGNKTKVQMIVTPGGAFPDGHRIIKEARKQVNYFNSPQRLHKLDSKRSELDFPKIRLENFPDTRVSFIVTLFRSVLCNHFLLLQHAVNDAEFSRLRDKLSDKDYRGMQEMEAVLSVAAEYATGESQSNSSKNSLLPWYRKVLSKSAYEDEYEVLVLSRQHQRTSIKRWPRETRQVRTDTCTTCTVPAPRTCPLIIARLFCRFQNLLTLGRNVLSACNSRSN